MLGNISLRSDWLPRRLCSVEGCSNLPKRHYVLLGARDAVDPRTSMAADSYYSFCLGCADTALENVPVSVVAESMTDEEVAIAEVMVL